MLSVGLSSVPFRVEDLFACTHSLRRFIWMLPLLYLRILLDEVHWGFFKYWNVAEFIRCILFIGSTV